MLSSGYCVCVCVWIWFDILLNGMLFSTNRMWNVLLLGSATENFVINFTGSQFQAQQTSMNLSIKSGLLGHFWPRNPLKDAVCSLKTHYMKQRARLEHTTGIFQMPCTRDWHLETVRSQSNKVANFKLFKWYRVCTRTRTSFSAPLIKIVCWFYCLMEQHLTCNRKIL
jgi:hypothetical protein